MFLVSPSEVTFNRESLLADFDVRAPDEQKKAQN